MANNHKDLSVRIREAQQSLQNLQSALEALKKQSRRLMGIKQETMPAHKTVQNYARQIVRAKVDTTPASVVAAFAHDYPSSLQAFGDYLLGLVTKFESKIELNQSIKGQSNTLFVLPQTYGKNLVEVSYPGLSM